MTEGCRKEEESWGRGAGVGKGKNEERGGVWAAGERGRERERDETTSEAPASTSEGEGRQVWWWARWQRKWPFGAAAADWHKLAVAQDPSLARLRALSPSPPSATRRLSLSALSLASSPFSLRPPHRRPAPSTSRGRNRGVEEGAAGPSQPGRQGRAVANHEARALPSSGGRWRVGRRRTARAPSKVCAPAHSSSTSPGFVGVFGAAFARHAIGTWSGSGRGCARECV